jgi:mRNA interferase YafQ
MLKVGRGGQYKIRIGEDFKKGFKRMKKRKKPMSDLKKIIDILASGKDLPDEYDPHSLKGDLQGYWACQVGKNADWRLVYRVD